jgi:hypothetical protein
VVDVEAGYQLLIEEIGEQTVSVINLNTWKLPVWSEVCVATAFDHMEAFRFPAFRKFSGLAHLAED